ncbi:capsule biosynthesis protein [Pseudoroseicyclus tamaricis]|uniref:capsule biosynthesis protein n=1 Tax=Pseudoroseicyclus tamaricis TaxID=2705421 RepID=UPI00193F5461|nr:capsule biosynthesis protein [Pseudoroseicyclus tamaricis]
MSHNPNEGGPGAKSDGHDSPAETPREDKSVLSLAERKAAIAKAQAEKAERMHGGGSDHAAQGAPGKSTPRPAGQAGQQLGPNGRPQPSPEEVERRRQMRQRERERIAAQVAAQAKAAQPQGQQPAAKPAAQPQGQPPKPQPAKPQPAKPQAQPAKPQGQAKGEAPSVKSAPARSQLRKRHWALVFAFLYIVAIPTLATAWYMWERATDRYASEAGLSIRTQEIKSAIELLGGVAELGGGSSSDVDILHQYLQSQEMVAHIDDLIDLRGIWSKADAQQDPIFVYHAPGSIEDLVSYWERMVHVYKDSGTGILNIEAQAFTPEDAQLISQTIVSESSIMINRLSQDAQEDATRYAREELEVTLERVKEAREALTRFRNEHQLVDPEASIQSQMGILSQLQSQLANTLIELDLLRQTAGETDPRVEQAERRIEVIQLRIAEERAKLGLGGGVSAENPELFADLIGEYEGLAVEREFAEQSYTAARAAYDSAVAESQRQSRYLAIHVRPTLAETAEFPQRMTILALVAFFAFLAWAVIALAYYAFKDRR